MVVSGWVRVFHNKSEALLTSTTAGIGEAMLRRVPVLGNEQQDFRDLGLLMVRLMERATSLLDPTSLELRNPERWKEPIKSFLQRTVNSNSAELLKVRAIKCVELDFNINNIGYILTPLSGHLLF